MRALDAMHLTRTTRRSPLSLADKEGKALVDVGGPAGSRPSEFYDMERQEADGHTGDVSDPIR
jgi:hypothetical protein